MASDDGIRVHLLERYPTIGDLFAWDNLQVSDLRRSLRSPVSLYIADHHVGAPALSTVPLIQHGVGLPRTGSRRQVDAQPPASVRVAAVCSLWSNCGTCYRYM